MKRIFLEYIDLLKLQKKLGRMNITGGEPLIRSDLIDFLEFASGYKKYFSHFTLLTNGSLLTAENLKDLKQRAPIITNIQVSIEGPESINDAIRGEGTFQLILEKIGLIKKFGFPVHLAATISKLNHKKIFELLDLLLLFDIPLKLRRFVPIGGGAREIKSMLTPRELSALYKKTEQINSKFKLRSTKRKIIDDNTCASAIKNLGGFPQIFHDCGVHRRSIFAVMPNGDVYPCRLFPVVIGNVKKESLKKIYDTNYKNFVKSLKVDSRCKDCKIYEKCHGGAGCVSYAVNNNFSSKDPQCWI